MGCDTHGIIKKRVNGKNLLKVIKMLFDENAEIVSSDYIKVSMDAPFDGATLFDDGDSVYVDENAFISFTYKGEVRNLFYIVRNYSSFDEDSWYASFPHTWCTLGYYGDSVEIMNKLVGFFGGWVDDNDCDEEGFYSATDRREDVWQKK